MRSAGPARRSAASDLRKSVIVKATTCGNAIDAFAETCLITEPRYQMSNIKILHAVVLHNEELLAV